MKDKNNSTSKNQLNFLHEIMELLVFINKKFNEKEPELKQELTDTLVLIYNVNFIINTLLILYGKDIERGVKGQNPKELNDFTKYVEIYVKLLSQKEMNENDQKRKN